jgi:glucosamine--fructose-6-phosphate aminotransferase (isomerizing)
MAKQSGYLSSLSICNVPESSLVRESELVLLTRAGPEIGVASTKAFTTQLTALGMLVIALAKFHGTDAERERGLVQRLIEIPGLVEKTLHLDDQIRELAKRFADKHHALFLGRGVGFPIAMEGALKLKELSYVHAEGYAAGELKHGPIALLDPVTPLVAIATAGAIYDKVVSNVAEARARSAPVIAVATVGDDQIDRYAQDVLYVPETPEAISPVIAVLPLQLLAYEVAVARGTDVDQPRNLAKSVTVE